METQDRRKFLRTKLYVGLNYKILDQPAREVTSQTADISAGGVRIVLLEDHPVGTSVQLKFLLPHFLQEIKTVGKIVWTKELPLPQMALGKAFEAGIEFTYIHPHDQERIQKYVLEQEK